MEKARGDMRYIWGWGDFSTSFAATVVKKVLKTFAMSIEL